LRSTNIVKLAKCPSRNVPPYYSRAAPLKRGKHR